MKYRPYVSVDVETLGLDKGKSPIIEIGAVFDDGGPIDELKTFSAIFPHIAGDYWELGAVALNIKILEEIKAMKINTIEYADRIVRLKWEEFIDWLEDRAAEAGSYDQDMGWDMKKVVCLAGKNAATADIPWVRNNLEKYCSNPRVLRTFNEVVHYKVIDPGSMFMGRVEGGHVPSLGHINKITGRNENVSHRALDDAMDVVYAIRKHFELVSKGI